MDDNENNEDPRERPSVERRPYVRPRVEDSASFETLALGCAKQPPSISCLVSFTYS